MQTGAAFVGAEPGCSFMPWHLLRCLGSCRVLVLVGRAGRAASGVGEGPWLTCCHRLQASAGHLALLPSRRGCRLSRCEGRHVSVRHEYLQSHYGLERGSASVSRGPDGDPWLWTRGLFPKGGRRTGREAHSWGSWGALPSWAAMSVRGLLGAQIGTTTPYLTPSWAGDFQVGDVSLVYTKCHLFH